MKSARERAEETWSGLPASAQVAIDLNYLRTTLPNSQGAGKEKWLRDVSLSYGEHALMDKAHGAEPAPPEGSPTWAELASALADCVEAMDRRGMITKMAARQNAVALLSRIPKEPAK